MTPLTQVILANCEGLAFSRSVAVRATWAATFLRVHKRSFPPVGTRCQCRLSSPTSPQPLDQTNRACGPSTLAVNSALGVAELKQANVRYWHFSALKSTHERLLPRAFRTSSPRDDDPIRKVGAGPASHF